MNVTKRITRKQAQPILQASFPEYQGRKITVEFTKLVTFWDTNWGGGTRNTYRFVRADGKTANLFVQAPWDNPIEGQQAEMIPDVLIIQHAVFCGKDCGVTIYAHPSLLPNWLPGGTDAQG